MNAKPDFLESPSHALDFIPDDTECGRIAHSIDWASTTLGHPDSWSPALRMMAPFVLATALAYVLIATTADVKARSTGSRSPSRSA